LEEKNKMKMSKHTRILSVVLCIAVMLGIMSVGMFASAANNETAMVSWKSGGFSGISSSATVEFKDGSMLVDYSTDSNSYKQFAPNGWLWGTFTTDSLKTAEGATGFATAINIINAEKAPGATNEPKMLDVSFEVTVMIDGDKSNKKTYASTFTGLEVGKVNQISGAFADMVSKDTDKTPLDPAQLKNACNIGFNVNGYTSYFSASIKNFKAVLAPVYAYTDTADDVTPAVFGEEVPAETSTNEPTETSTNEPTETPTDEPTETPTEEPTEEPTETPTEEPTEEPTETPTEQPTQAPVTQAPTTVAPVTQAPTTVAPVTQAPTTVKKATVKKPYKVRGVKLKAGKKRVTVTFKKAKNAKKYIVKYSTKKNMKKAKTVTTKKLKVTIKKLQSKKRIYVQVQAVNGSVKGKISSRVSVKVK
jgi:hypothetical protein